MTVTRPAAAGSREPRPLDGVRVLELASTDAVGLAGRLLAARRKISKAEANARVPCCVST